MLPAGIPRRVDRGVGGRAMVLAPLVGVVVGGVAAAVVALAQLVRPDAELLAAVLGVLVVAGLSGGLHLDGLADFADALGSRRDPETMLRIMKQSDIGPFGVVAIVGVLLVDVAALTACVQAGFGWQAILIATVASRLTLPWSCRTTIPAARPDGLGTIVAATVRPITATFATALVLAATTALTWQPHQATQHQAVPHQTAQHQAVQHERVDYQVVRHDAAGATPPTHQHLNTPTSPRPTAATAPTHQHLNTPTSLHPTAATAPTHQDLTPTTWLELTDAAAPTRQDLSTPNWLHLSGGAGAVLLAVAISFLISRTATRKLGGTTGDVLGATVELALPVALLSIALTV
ncbi:adenosylcobinamide-GDP ribazoletransferase [Kribbella jejuensis]